MAGQHGNDTWGECLPGTLTEFSVRAREQRQRVRQRKSLTVAAASVAAVGCCLLAFSYVPGSSAPSPVQPERRALTCVDVLRTVDAFLANTLVPAERERVEQHLSHCPSCQKKYQQRAEEQGLPLAVQRPPREPVGWHVSDQRFPTLASRLY
ncbi:MAG: zf-HC2 domain-containing protein [Planctomycetales bacterium]|nr:zf-HC2 domain-containing protein [Planctomycetales bacterium]